eukprot:12941553-Alexandrium_andersonii.AAC.1
MAPSWGLRVRGLALQEAQEARAGGPEDARAVVIHLDRPGEAAATGFAFAPVEEHGTRWHL